MNKILRIFALTACVLSGYMAYAQSALKVSGTVKDSEGFPVVGAAVMVEGYQSAGVVTDIDGNYTLTIPAKAVAKAVLNVSCLSYETQTKAVNDKAVINFVLRDDSEQLDEVVVVGYGSLRRSDLTGSVTSVKIDDGDAGRASSLDQLLKGKAAGVSVISNNAGPDAGLSIRVRGATSLNGSNEPLYVIDGVIMSTPGGSGINKGEAVEDVNPLMGINPQDIASMEILKDASATAIYGAAGANGVVLITTKSANRDRPTINFNAGIDISQQYKKIEMLSFDEFLMYARDQYLASKDFMSVEDLTEDNYTSLYSRYFTDPINMTGLKVDPVNWQDYIMRTAVSQRYYFSVAGRPKTLTYNFSVGYQNKQGIVKQTGAEQFTLRLNATKQLFKNFQVGTKSNLAYITSSMTQGMSTGALDGATSMMRSMLTSRPYTGMGNIVDDTEEWDTGNLRATPAKWLSDFQSLRAEYRITPHVFADWKILPWMELKSSFGGDFRLRERTRWKGQTINYGSEGSIASNSSQISYRWNWDTTLNFKKEFGKHKLNGTVGMTMGRYQTTTSVVEAWMVPEYKAQHLAINTGQDQSMSYSESATSEMSYFGRALYNYGDRYLLTATVRVDGSSKFSEANRFSVFPSFAAAWRFSEEPWLKNVEWLSMGKLRAGWGQVGNSAVSAYQIYSTFGTANYPDHTPGNDAHLMPGIAPTNISNPLLKWETTEQLNFGLDLGFFDGRLSFTADVYDKFTYDLLQSKNISSSSGFKTMWLNDGSIRNRGLELAIDTTPIKIGDFEWNLAGQISWNRNTLVDLGSQGGAGNIYMSPDDVDGTECIYYKGSTIGGSNYVQTYANIFIQGMPMGLFYGYKTDGIVPEGERGLPLTPPSEGVDTSRPAGSVQYLDLNGNGYLDEGDRTIIGDPNADFIYGFSTAFRWKNLSISASFDGSYGNDILNANLAQELDTAYNSTPTNYWNVRREAYFDAWSPSNPNGKYQRLGLSQGDNTERRAMSDRRIEDGSFLRLSNVSISYKLPIPKNKVFRNVTVGVTGGNLYVWTKYSGWDPEVNSYGNNMMKLGIDTGSYPTARTYSFDLKFTF